jgi:hypothetical protein
MAGDDRVTMRQVYDTLLEVKRDLKELNGTVKQNCTDIAVLKEKQAHIVENTARVETVNEGRWKQVWSTAVQPVLSVVIGAVLALVLYGQIKP